VGRREQKEKVKNDELVVEKKAKRAGQKKGKKERPSGGGRTLKRGAKKRNR